MGGGSGGTKGRKTSACRCCPPRWDGRPFSTGGCCSLELMAQSQFSCLPLLLRPLLSSGPLESIQQGWGGRDKGYILPLRMPVWKLRYWLTAVSFFFFGQSHFESDSSTKWVSHFGEVFFMLKSWAIKAQKRQKIQNKTIMMMCMPANIFKM